VQMIRDANDAFDGAGISLEPMNATASHTISARRRR